MNKIKTRDKNFIRKGERGSVTLFVLIAMMFFLTVGVGVYMANVNTQQAQQKGVKKVQLEYSSTDNIDNIYKDQVEKLGQKLIIVVKDSENKIYQEGTWTNKLPLTIIANWPDGTKESEKEVSLTSPSKVAKKYSFDKENTALILDSEDNNIENGKWTAQVEVGGKKQSVEIWIDTIAPTCTITAEPDKNPTNADSITFTLKNEDLLSKLVSNIDYSKLENIITVTDKNNNKLENGSDVTWDWIENENNKVKFTINKDDFEGNIKITIPADTLTDNAGNKSEEVTKEVKIDKKAPTCTITANPDKNPTNASSIVYTFKWSEEVSGFTTEDITVTNGTKGIFTAKSATEYTLAVTTQANQNNTQTINVAAGKCTDIAENGNIAVNKEVKIDRVTPTCTITANPDKNPTNASSITYTFTWSEEVTGFTTEDITVTKGTKGTFTKTSGTVYTLVVTTQANQDNTQTINVAAGKCTDIAGNENAAISKEVKIDRKSPTCTITANPNTSPTNASSITYTFTWSEEVTGFTTEDITVTNGTKGTFTKTSGTVYTLVVTTAAKQDNTQKVVINTNVCTDVVGNVNIAASKEVKIDRKAPTATSCEVKNITATGYDVYVYGVTDSTGVDRVLFPTWTQNNGQDDIQANWWETTNDTAKGKNLGNGTWHYRVNVTDHKNEYGTYTTHVYTYDTLGNKQICSSTNIEVPAVNITYLSDNLVYGLENRSSTTDHNMTYSISNGVVTVTANASDGWGNTTGRVYLEANTQYEFTCTTSATSGTWGNSVEAFLLLNGSTSTYIRMDSNNNYRFTPAQSGTYYIRLDVNTSGKTYTFSNIDVRKIVLTENKNYGLTLTTLPDYSRTGYTFNGWFTAKTGGTKIATTTPVPGVNTTYYAQTKANTYTVKYDGNGATSGSTASSSHTYNVAKALTANGFARTGYTFNGWNTKADGTGTSYANSASVINLTSTNGATVTLYAKWKINQYNIDLNYNVDGTTYWSGYQGRIKAGLKIGGVDKGYVADYGGSSNYGTSWEIYGLQLDGVNVAYTQKGTLGASNLNLLVYFYTISFKADSATYGSVSASSVIVPKNNTTYSTSDKTFKLSDGRTVTASTKSVTGYTSNFTGWSSTTGTITAAISITAKFSGTLITYKIGYTLNGGTVSGNPTSYNITTNTITLKNPTRTGYTFAGWTGSNGTTKQTTVTIPKGSTGNKTYTANWTANTYTINLNNQSATTAGTTAIYEKYNVGIYKESACTNKMTTTANAITKPERKYTVTFNYNGSGKANTTGTATWTFGGYYTATAGSGTQMINASGNVTDNLTSTKYTATATLYANWTGGTVRLPTPTRTGYTFAGWYTAASGGTKIESTSKFTSAQTLYAHWTTKNYTLKIDPNGGTLNNSTAVTTSTVAYGATKAPGTPTRTGYTFAGWVPTKTEGTDKATWVEVFYHNNNFGSTLFASDEEALSSNTRDKYSILNKLESFRANTSSAFEFLLKYDELGSAYNRWKQTSNPTTSTTISGYSAVAISWTANSWGGLVKNSGNTFIDGSPSATTWFYAIGAKAKWDIGIPGPSSPGITQGTSLWVKANSDLSNIEKFITGVVDSNGNYIVRHDVTLKAVWIPNVYAINLNNQSATSAGTTAIYEKYNVGIYKELACTNKMTTTANAITKPERKYTVTFNYNGSGKANTTGTATWTFGGYYTATAGSGTQMINASGNVTDNLTSTKYTATATLYANWTGGTVSLPTPTRTGYTFAGWYTAASGGNKIESTSKITSAQTLYAHWTDTTAPTVTFGTNGNTTYDKSQSTTVTVTDSGSGVNTSSLKYQWTQSTTAPAESTFSTTFTSGKAITKNTGTGSNWYLWILAKDNAGNKTIKRSNAFYLDNTAPTASVSPTAPVAKNKVTITLKDAHSKVKYWAVTTSTTAPTTTSTTITTNTSTLNTWYPVTAATQVSTTFTPGTASKHYIWVKDSAGNGATAYAATFTPTPANYEISKSGATTYYETTLANATANAVTGSTIKVLNSVTESTAATIEEGKSLTVNTNQKTITMNNCNITNKGSLVVNGQGTIKCSTGKSEGSVILSTGNLTIGSVTIVNTVGEGIYAGGTMNMSAGTVTGKTAGIEVTGTTTITGGTVSATGSNEGAIEPGGLGGKATININGGTITGDFGICQGGQRVETAQVIVNIGATSGDVNGGPVVKGNKNAIGMNNGGTVNFYQGKLQGGTERVSTIPFSAIRSGYMVYLNNTSSTTVHTISLKPTSFGTAVAMINNINYYTIQAAIECCGNAETTIEQISDITSGTVIAKTAKDHNIIWTKKVGNYTSEISATGTMVENNGKLTMKLIYIEIEGGTASPIITNNGDLTLWGGEYHNYVNSASIVNNLGSGNITTKEAVDIDGSGYGIYSTSIGTVSVTSLSTISGGTYGIYSSGLGHVVVNQGTVYGTKFGIYARGDCDVTFGTLGSTYNKISGIQAMGKSGVSVNITGGEGEITNSSGIAIETSAASVNIDDEQATIQGTTQGIKTISGNITVKKGIVKATGTAAPGILTTTGSITLGVNDGTVSTTTPAITGNGNAAIVKNDPKTGTMAMYDGRLKGTAPVVSASAAGAANYEYNGGTIIKPEGYSLNITLGFAILKK